MQFKKIKILLCLALMLPMLEPLVALATAPGESFSVTIPCGTYEGEVAGKASNATLTSASSWCERGGSLTATAVAGSVGTASISFVAVDLINTTTPPTQIAEGTVIGSDAVYVTAPSNNSGGNSGGSGNGGGGGSNSGGGSDGGYQPQAPTTPQAPTEKKSSNADLKSLSVSTGTMSPEFNAETTDYKVSLPKDATTISVEAEVSDSKASVSGTGEHTLEAGENEIKISCTAEDGTVKDYIINVIVDETPDVFVTYNGKKLGVVKNIEDVSAPESFEATTVPFEGKEVKGWKSNLRNLTILYMVDEASEKNFYIYDTTKGTITSVYKPMALLGRNIAIIDIPSELQTRAGMKFGEVEVDKQKMPGWTFEESSFANYALVYLMDEQGKTHYYLYEKSENTLQLYSNQAALTQSAYEQSIADYEEKVMTRMYMIIALLVTNILTVVLLVVLILKKKTGKKGRTYNNTEDLRQDLNYDEDPFQQPEMMIHENMDPENEDKTLHLDGFMHPVDDEE